MMYAALHHWGVATLEFDEQLRADERTIRFQLNALQRIAPEELESAIDVAHAQAKHEPNDNIVDLRDEQPVHRVAPPDTIAEDDRRALEHAQEPRQFLEVELTICIREKHKVFLSACKPGAQRGTIPPIHIMSYEPDVGIAPRQVFHHGGRLVRTAVIDDDDLIVVDETRDG